MIKTILKTATALACSAVMFSCNQQKTETTTMTKDNEVSKTVSIKTQEVDYTAGGVTMKGYVAFNDSLKGPLPVVMIVHEWWGLTEYPKMRAKQMAELGYFAFAVDMYGDGKTAETPDEAGALSKPFYGSMKVAGPRFEAALAKLSSFPNADTSRIGAMGYCFGGSMVLNMARTGEPLKGVVSFHGNLAGEPANKDLLKAEVLVCHGDSDKFVSPSEVATFKKQMDSIGAKYIFKSYANATHAFTNPMADEKAKKYKMPIAYNPAADTASFNEMKAFFERVLK